MFRTIALAAALLAFSGGVALAQSSTTTTTRSTTTTTTEGTKTRTETRTRSTEVTIGVDGEALGAAIAGAIADAADPEQARLRRLAEPAKKEDAFGAWRMSDGGRDTGDCRVVLGEKAGFLGVRPATATGCPGRLEQLRTWRVQMGELVFYDRMGQEARRLKFVEGRFIGGGLELVRETPGEAPAADPAGSPVG